MTRFPFHPSGLRDARRAAGRTAADVAAAAGISRPTLRQAERGEGRLSSAEAAIGALALAWDGLPPAPSIGRALAVARERRGWSVRRLSALSGVGAAALHGMEDGGDPHLATLAAAAQTLGIRLALRPAGAPAAFWTGPAASSAVATWTTPPDLLDRLYEALGDAFDLDPCSPGSTRSPVRARLHYTPQDDGLMLPWRGAVFLNPPYGRGIGAWMRKARTEAETDRARPVIALVPARPDTRWWHDSVAGYADAWMLRGRLRFGGGEAAAPFPSALLAWGGAEIRDRLRHAFPDAWHVPG